MDLINEEQLFAQIAACKYFDCRTCAFPLPLPPGVVADMLQHRHPYDVFVDKMIADQMLKSRYDPFVDAAPGSPAQGLVKLPNPFKNQLHFSRFRNTPTDKLHGLAGGYGPR